MGLWSQKPFENNDNTQRSYYLSTNSRDPYCILNNLSKNNRNIEKNTLDYCKNKANKYDGSRLTVRFYVIFITLIKTLL